MRTFVAAESFEACFVFYRDVRGLALFGRMRAAWLRDPAGTLIELQQW